MKTNRLRRWQRIASLIVVALILAMLWPFFSAKQLKTFWPNSRFTIPNIPEITTNPTNQAETKIFHLILVSNDPALLAKLQQQGWPAYLAGKEIHIGPYLASFKSQLDLNKIRQMTSIPVKMGG